MNATRIVTVPVEVASHTKQLAKASVDFAKSCVIASVRRAPAADTRLLSGVEGSPVIDAEAGVAKLAAQVSQTVQLADCLQGCIEGGATAFLEFGPGSALSAGGRRQSRCFDAILGGFRNA
jgi:[acyl-carrier-protein] S-malonyltransferase